MEIYEWIIRYNQEGRLWTLDKMRIKLMYEHGISLAPQTIRNLNQILRYAQNDVFELGNGIVRI